MENAPTAIVFEATIDELVDVAIRWARRSSAHIAERRKFILVSGGFGALAALVAFGVASRADGVRDWAVAVAVVSVIGLVIGLVMGLLYEPLARSRVRRYLRRMYQGRTTVPCEIRLLQEKLWTRQGDVEVAFQWSSCTEITDTADAFEVHFRDGVVVLRDRHFVDSVERSRALAECRSMASNGAA